MAAGDARRLAGLGLVSATAVMEREAMYNRDNPPRKGARLTGDTIRSIPIRHGGGLPKRIFAKGPS